MARVKRGTTHTKTRKNLLKNTKGFRWGRKSEIKQATQAVLHAHVDAYRGRKEKKRDFRGLWNIHISSALQRISSGLSYSAFMGLMKKKQIIVNRKMLSGIAKDYPETFEKIVQEVK